MPRLHGIIETALYVSDPPRAAVFYQRVFGLKPLLESEKLIALAVADRSVLLLFKQGATAEPATLPGGTIPAHGAAGPSHFAFAIADDEVPAWREHLRREGVPIEGEVTWPGNALSLYFRDPDGHLGELLTPGFWKNY
jgi:catechol 2,3-dioxygenase-like lactoylglutathione lyase family enzyme